MTQNEHNTIVTEQFLKALIALCKKCNIKQIDGMFVNNESKIERGSVNFYWGKDKNLKYSVHNTKEVIV